MNMISTGKTRAFFLALLTLSLLVTIQIAQADGEPGYIWEINFDFEDGLDGDLTIKMGPMVDGQIPAPIVERHFPIACSSIGSVTLQNGSAIFDGTGYISCNLDLQSKIEQTQAFCQTQPGAECPEAPEDSVQLHTIFGRANANVAKYGFVPLFYHPDFKFWLNQDSINMSVNTTAGRMTANANLGVTLNTFQNYTTMYECTNEASPQCQSYLRSGNIVALMGHTTNDLIQFTLTQTPLYIGFNPDNGTYMKGEMGSLRVDPPAFGSHGD